MRATFKNKREKERGLNMRGFWRKVKKLGKAITWGNFKAVLRYVKHNGFQGLATVCLNHIRFGKTVLDEYATWMANNEPNEQELEKQRKYVSCQSIKFQVIGENLSGELMDSIKRQTYQNFTVQEIQANLYQSLLENNDSDYMIFLGSECVLAPFAFYEIVKSIEYRDSLLIYADNDCLIEGKRQKPHFKPDFARDTVLSQNYLGDLIAVKTAFLKVHPDFLSQLGKNVILDLSLQISEKTRKIEHIQKILYHQTCEEKSVDVQDEKSIIAKHLDRLGLIVDSIDDGVFKGQYHIRYRIEGNPKISIVIPNKDHQEDLDKAIQSILVSTYQNYEIIVVENNSEKEETFAYYQKIQEQYPQIKVVPLTIPYFNYSRIVNFGVENASGEYVVLLNNDIEFITKDWMEELLMYAQRKDVAICGAKLLFPDRSIQHAGVTIGTRGLAGHRFREMEEHEYHIHDYINIVQDLSAVTAACFMVRRELYIGLLGFDEKLAVAFNDVDFCLKARTAKYLIVYNPFVQAYHYESKSRGQDVESEEKQKRFAKEYELFVKRWAKVIGKGDPYYNKNYRLDTDLPKINYNKIVY